MGLAYYEENKDKLKLVAVDDGDPANGAGPIAPSAETVRDGTYRPLSRPLFIYVNATALSRPEVQKFVEYYVTQAAPLVSGGRLRAADRRRTAARAHAVRSEDDRHDVRSASTARGPTISLEQRLRGEVANVTNRQRRGSSSASSAACSSAQRRPCSSRLASSASCSSRRSRSCARCRLSSS